MHGTTKKIVLFAILLLGLLWRLFFLYHGSLWPDEALYLCLAKKLSYSPLNLTDSNDRFFFLNPPLFMYLLSLLSYIAHENLILLGRLLTIFFDVGTIYLVYRLAYGLFYNQINPLHVWMSTRILVDLSLTFFIYLALLLLFLGRLGWFFSASTAAFLTKYPALPLFIMPFTERFRRKPGIWHDRRFFIRRQQAGVDGCSPMDKVFLGLHWNA